MWPALESVCHLNQNLTTGDTKSFGRCWFLIMWRMGGQPTTWILLLPLISIWNSRKFIKQFMSHLKSWFFIHPGGFWSCDDGWVDQLPGSCRYRFAHILRDFNWENGKTHNDKTCNRTKLFIQTPPASSWSYDGWVTELPARRQSTIPACCHK